ncbi:MAG: hypothetical protein IPJ78_10305 [Gemmatimonadetes bacterium]|nr:hypothetical protein [Gemmatimonadota bacterium]
MNAEETRTELPHVTAAPERGLPYNGWRALVRNGPRYGAYERARRWGVLPIATECLCCRAALPLSAIPYHAEEYGPTHEDFWQSCVPMCHRCHAWLHARFVMPNLWKLLVSQGADGAVDEDLFPPRKGMAKIRRRKDIATQALSQHANDYFGRLSTEEYRGPWKAATLLVRPLAGDRPIEVPDWEVYGERLEWAHSDERRELLRRGIPVDPFLSGRIAIERDSAGRLWYDPLYRASGWRRPFRRVAAAK